MNDHYIKTKSPLGETPVQWRQRCQNRFCLRIGKGSTLQVNNLLPKGPKAFLSTGAPSITGSVCRKAKKEITNVVSLVRTDCQKCRWIYQGCVQKCKVIVNVLPWNLLPSDEHQEDQWSRTKRSWVSSILNATWGQTPYFLFIYFFFFFLWKWFNVIGLLTDWTSLYNSRMIKELMYNR